jgi:hypothetical protein
LSTDDIQNVYTALTVRSFDKDLFILSTLNNESNKNKLNVAGVNEIINEKELVGVIAREFVGKPVAFEAIDTLRSNDTSIDIYEIVINERILENVSGNSFQLKKLSQIMLDVNKFDEDTLFTNLRRYTNNNRIIELLKAEKDSARIILSILEFSNMWYSNVYGEPRLDVIKDSKTDDVIYVILFPNGDWDSWGRLVKEIKDEMERSHLKDYLSKVVIVCLEGLTE